jgi:MFS family permease
VAAPGYAHGLAWLARPLIPLLEGSPGTRYDVEGSRLVAYRPVWLPQQGRAMPLAQPLWVGAQNFGLPLLAALVLATPGWRWRRRARALAIGLLLLSVTQIAQLAVVIEATQQSPIASPEGPVHLPRYSPGRQPLFYALYYFFDLMGRGFFALLVYAGLVAAPAGAALTAPAGGRNARCSCGSGRKYKHCCGA